MTLFRKQEYCHKGIRTWSVEFALEDNPTEWYDLFDDPSSIVCDIVVEALAKVNPAIVTEPQEREQ